MNDLDHFLSIGSSGWSLGGVRLEPLGFQHEAGLREAAADGALWKLWFTSVPEPEQTRAYIETAHKMCAEGSRFAFAVIDEATGGVLGSTSYHDIVPAAQRVEIGYTWYRKSTWRSHVNTACKLILMRHAFDTLKLPVVGWRTDIFNSRSQRAIERLGARRDGVIRHHALRPNGSIRDTVMYSMLAAEWPAAKAKLEARLAQPADAALPAREVRIVPLSELTVLQAGRLAMLSPGALGERMVAHNGGSIAQAAVSPCAVLRAAVWGEGPDALPAGMVLLYDPQLSPAARALADSEGDDPGSLGIWRLSVGLAHQGRGVGEALMQWAIAYARERGCFHQIELSHMPGEGNASPFYERFGFRHNGEMDDDERVMVLKLAV
jgi:N-acetyltransferase